MKTEVQQDAVEARAGKSKREEVSDSTNIKPLPNEIIQNILGQFTKKTDKHTLAQCMRVSPTLNSLAAPLLYRSITIDDSTRSRFAEFPQMPNGMERLTEDKLFNVKYVDQVRFQYAHESDCVSNLLPGSHALNVSILNIFEVGDWDGLSKGTESRCTCTDNINPSKIVYEGSSFIQHITDTLPSRPPIATITSLFGEPAVSTFIGKSWIKRHAYILCKRPTLAKQLVFVLRSTGPPSAHNYRRLGQTLEDIRDSVFRGIQEDEAPDYVLANFETLLARDKKDTTGRSLVDIVTAGIEEAYTLYVYERASLGVPAKPYNQVRQGQIRFVSMKTYLTEYDWRGEFTEEQVKQWLI